MNQQSPRRSKKIKFDPTPPDIDELSKHNTLEGTLDYAKWLTGGIQPPSEDYHYDRSGQLVPGKLSYDNNIEWQSPSTLIPGSTVIPDSTIVSGITVEPDSTVIPSTTPIPSSTQISGTRVVELNFGLKPDPNPTPQPTTTTTTVDPGTSVASNFHVGGAYKTYRAKTLNVASLDANVPSVNGRSYVLRAIRLAQDGLSGREEKFYTKVWYWRGRPKQGCPYIEVKASLRDLAMHTGLTKANCIAMLRSLKDKLVTEILDDGNAAEQRSKTYRFYSLASILQRWRAAGFTHFITPGGKVYLVRASSTVVPVITVESMATVELEASSTVAMKASSTVEPQSNSKEESNNLLVEEDDVDELIRAFRTDPFQEALDQEMATRLLTKCRSLQPDIRIAEIMRLVRIRWDQVMSNRGVRNSIPYLVEAVARLCVGEPFKHVRQSYEADLHREEQKRAENEEIMRQLQQLEKENMQ